MCLQAVLPSRVHDMWNEQSRSHAPINPSIWVRTGLYTNLSIYKARTHTSTTIHASVASSVVCCYANPCPTPTSCNKQTSIQRNIQKKEANERKSLPLPSNQGLSSLTTGRYRAFLGLQAEPTVCITNAHSRLPYAMFADRKPCSSWIKSLHHRPCWFVPFRNCKDHLYQHGAARNIGP